MKRTKWVVFLVLLGGCGVLCFHVLGQDYAGMSRAATTLGSKPAGKVLFKGSFEGDNVVIRATANSSSKYCLALHFVPGPSATNLQYGSAEEGNSSEWKIKIGNLATRILPNAESLTRQTGIVVEVFTQDEKSSEPLALESTYLLELQNQRGS